MNDDYLWDKSGQPDPQVQQLEEILGTLRYQPKPLDLPHDLQMPRRRSYFPALAIAATLLVALLAAGIWFKARTPKTSEQHRAQVPVPAPVKEDILPNPDPPKDPRHAEESTPNKERVAVNNRRRNKSSFSALRGREREEALAAKEQVMLALRLASEKLNLAHKKTQNTTPANQIKNQHRIG